jgi:hypothetical protein
MEWPDKSLETPEYLLKRVRAGTGCGSGRGYKPWTTFRRRGGHGSDRLFSCTITGRQIDLPTIAHDAYYFLLERRHTTISIEETFPLLNVTESLAACAAFGVKHPTRDGLVEPITLDFLIRERMADGSTLLHARTVAKVPENPTSASLFHVMHSVSKHGVGWKLVDRAPLTNTLASSLRFARSWALERFQPGQDDEVDLARAFMGTHRPSMTLKEVIDKVAAKLRCTSAEALQRFRYAAWRGRIRVDFTHELRLDKPVQLLAVSLAGITRIKDLIEILSTIGKLRDVAGLQFKGARQADKFLQLVEASMLGMAWSSIAIESQAGTLTGRFKIGGKSLEGPTLLRAALQPFISRTVDARTADYEVTKRPRSSQYPYESVLFPVADAA